MKLAGKARSGISSENGDDFSEVGSLRQTQMADEDEEECDELNVQSEKFNALHALYSSKTIVPFPSAPVLDNVAKATSLLARNQDLVNTPNPSARQKRGVKSSTSANAATTATAIAETETKTGTSKKPQKNVFTRMEDMKGPLAFLKTCMEKRIRVKVWTRTARGIRGYCLGFVVAFDKHWNLVLEDVREVWTRRVKRKQFLLGEAPSEMPLAWKAMGPMVKPPKVVVTGGRRGTEHCERHVNQMLMRGRAEGVQSCCRLPNASRADVKQWEVASNHLQQEAQSAGRKRMNWKGRFAVAVSCCREDEANAIRCSRNIVRQPVLQQKLKYAINFCKSLDTDEYARVAIPGNAVASTSSDSEDMESIASDGPVSV